MAKKTARRKPAKRHIRKQKKSPINFVRELSKGIKVEMEHTKGLSKASAYKKARKIALDHLRETPYYYQRLKKCFPRGHNPLPAGRSYMVAQLRENPTRGGREPKTYMSKNYAHKVLLPNWKRSIDPRSIRTKTIKTKAGGKRLLRIGCPKGQWIARQQRCKVGTKAISILTPKAEKILSLPRARAAATKAGNPDKEFWRERSIQASRMLGKCLSTRKDPESQKMTDLSNRLTSNLQRLSKYEEYFEKRGQRRNPGAEVLGVAKLEKMRVPFRKSKQVWVVPPQIVDATVRRVVYSGGPGSVVIGPNMVLDVRTGGIYRDTRFPSGNPRNERSRLVKGA